MKDRSKIIRIVNDLARALIVKRNSLCFCGSTSKFKKCCGSLNNMDLTFIDNLTFLEEALETAKAYALSQGRPITGIPAGIWRQAETASLNRLICLYPGCTNKPINCHLTPRNVLRSSFGGHCKEYTLVGLEPQFGKVGINKAGCLPVFCADHDDRIFKRVDTLRIDRNSKEHMFLLGLKAIAFSLRRTQYYLGIDSQVAIFGALGGLSERNHIDISIDHLQDQYVRFIVTYNFFQECVFAYAASDFDFFVSLYRSMPYKDLMFASTFTTIPYDLEGQKINQPAEVAVAIACNIFTIDNQLHVIYSCPRGNSATFHQNFLRQLGEVDDDEFIIILNNILTLRVEAALMPVSFSPSEDDLRKINAAGQFAKQSMQPGGPAFDLKNTSRAIKFI